MRLALAVCAIVLFWLALASPDLGTSVVLGSMGVFSLALYLLTTLAPNSSQFGLADFRLGSWLLAFAAVAYGLASLSLAEEQEGILRIVDRSVALPALLMISCGLILFTLGYRFGPAHYARVATSRLLRSSTTRAAATAPRLILVYCFGLLATAALVVVQGGYGYIGGADLTAASSVSPWVQPLTILTFLRTASLFGLSARWAATKVPGAAVTLLIVALIEVTIGLLTGLKESFIVVALAVGIPLVLARRPRRIPWTAAVVAIAVFILFVTPFVTALRGEVRGGGQRLNFMSSVSLGLDALVGNRGQQTATRDENIDQVSSRIRLADNAIVIIDKTPSMYPYRPATDIILAPVTGLIPRAVWPSKPLRLSGLEFYKTYYQGAGMSSSAITLQGSLYMHGGWLVLAAGMLAFGVLLRGVDDAVAAAVQGRTRMGAGLLPLMLFSPIVKQELDINTLLASAPVYVVTYLIAIHAITSRSSHRDIHPLTRKARPPGFASQVGVR